MKIELPHHTTPAQAKKKLTNLLTKLKSKHEDLISDLDQRWEGDKLVFGFKAKGMSAKGHIEITDDAVLLDGKLPLLARPFESKIKKLIESEAKSLFKKA